LVYPKKNNKMVKANEKLEVGKYKLPDKPNQKQNLCLCLRQRRKAANSNKHGDGKPEKEAPQPAEIRIRRIPRTWRHLPNWRKLWLTSVSVWVRPGFWFWFAKCHQTINKREVASTGKKEREVKGRRTPDETGTGTWNWPPATGDNIRVRLLGDYM